MRAICSLLYTLSINEYVLLDLYSILNLQITLTLATNTSLLLWMCKCVSTCIGRSTLPVWIIYTGSPVATLCSSAPGYNCKYIQCCSCFIHGRMHNIVRCAYLLLSACTCTSLRIRVWYAAHCNGPLRRWCANELEYLMDTYKIYC